MALRGTPLDPSAGRAVASGAVQGRAGLAATLRGAHPPLQPCTLILTLTVYAHSRMHTHARTHTCTHIHTNTHTHVRTHTRTRTQDATAEMAVGKKAVREKAETDVLGSVGAPMAGTVIEVQVRPSPCVQMLRGCTRVAGWLGVCCAALRAAVRALCGCVPPSGCCAALRAAVRALCGCVPPSGCCAALCAAAEGLRACVKVAGRALRSPVCRC